LKLAIRLWLVMLISTSLIACGFHLRGAADISFSSIYIQGSTLVITKNLKKSLRLNGVKVLDTAENAELLLDLVGEESEKRILSLSGKGTVNEFELYYRVHYRTKLAGEPLWHPVQTVEERRDYSYSDANLLAKQGEEKRLNEDMQNSVMNAIVRRLATLKK
jgi:LPS-assembly lipoprotein